MQRLPLLFSLLICALGLGCAACIAGDEPSLAEQAKAALAKHKTLSYQLPDRPIFQTAEGQQKLELTEEQKTAIRDIGSVFNGKVLDQRQATWEEERAKAEKLSGEAKQKFLDEFWAQEGERMEQRRKWALEARALVEKLFTEKQLQLLRELEFAQRTPHLIHQPQFFNELQLDAEQQAKLQDVRTTVEKRRQELMNELMKSQTEGSQKLVDLLTPEQREKLRVLLDEAYQSMIQVR